MTTLTPANAPRRLGATQLQRIPPFAGGLIMGIYGPGNAGKTTLAATITDSELGTPALLLNAKGNPFVIEHYADKIDLVEIKQFAQVEATRQAVLQDKQRPWKSVILDNVSEMWSMDLSELYGPTTDVEWTKHSASTADILQLHRSWIDLAMATGINVVFIYQESNEARTIRGQKVESRSELGFNRALQSQVPSLLNMLGRLYVISDPPVYRRMIDFRPIETMHQSKLQLPPALLAKIPYEQYDPSLADILDTLKGGREWPTAKHKK